MNINDRINANGNTFNGKLYSWANDTYNANSNVRTRYKNLRNYINILTVITVK